MPRLVDLAKSLLQDYNNKSSNTGSPQSNNQTQQSYSSKNNTTSQSNTNQPPFGQYNPPYQPPPQYQSQNSAQTQYRSESASQAQYFCNDPSHQTSSRGYGGNDNNPGQRGGRLREKRDQLRARRQGGGPIRQLLEKVGK